jgi:hypothetical protein
MKRTSPEQVQVLTYVCSRERAPLCLLHVAYYHYVVIKQYNGIIKGRQGVILYACTVVYAASR